MEVDNVVQLSGFKIGVVAPRTEVSEHVFDINGFKTRVSYYRNRITLESDRGEIEEILNMFPETEDETISDQAKRNDATQYKAAKDLCELVVKWDWMGPLENKRGHIVVAEGEAIPLDPEIVRLIPIRITQALNTAIVRRELGGNDGSKPKRSQRDG